MKNLEKLASSDRHWFVCNRPDHIANVKSLIVERVVVKRKPEPMIHSSNSLAGELITKSVPWSTSWGKLVRRASITRGGRRDSHSVQETPNVSSVLSTSPQIDHMVNAEGSRLSLNADSVHDVQFSPSLDVAMNRLSVLPPIETPAIFSNPEPEFIFPTLAAIDGTKNESLYGNRLSIGSLVESDRIHGNNDNASHGVNNDILSIRKPAEFPPSIKDSADTLSYHSDERSSA